MPLRQKQGEAGQCRYPVEHATEPCTAAPCVPGCEGQPEHCPPGMLQRCQRTPWLTFGICFSFHPICFRLLLPFWLLHISQAVTRLSLQQWKGL